MIYFLENEEGEVEKATCGGMVAESEYVRVVDTKEGIDIFVSGELRCHLNYAELSRVYACLKMIEDANESELLGYFDIYKGEKI